MSKLADKLRKMGVYNTHDMLTHFRVRGISPIACVYFQSETMRSGRSAVFSPFRKSDPDAPWYNYGKKTFVGKRAESMPKAIAWATEQYGIEEWAPCPFGGAYIPKAVLAAAKRVKEQPK